MSATKTRHTEDLDTRRVLDVIVDRPDRHTAVFTVSGEVDLSTVPRLTELLKHRLFSEVHIVVVDLSHVTFFGSCGVQLLCEAQQRANDRHIALRLVTPRGGHPERVFRLIGVDHRFARYSSRDEALTSVAPLRVGA